MKPAPVSDWVRPCGCSQLWTAAPGGHRPECPELRREVRKAVYGFHFREVPFNRPPDRMRPEESEAAWFQNQRRLPWCAVCKKGIPAVKVTRLGNGGEDADREFIVECHGQRERTVLSAEEVRAMSGYGRAFASEGVRDG